MKLKTVILHCFRGYNTECRIPIGELTALIGKNDIGKSSALEAIGIFLDSPGMKAEITDMCVHGQPTEMRIGCVFTDLPGEIVIDAASRTTLAAEHMLNNDGDLEIHRVYQKTGSRLKDSYVAIAEHPTASNRADLLLLKNSGLKERAEALGIDLTNVNRSINARLRKAIWDSSDDLNLRRTEIALDKEDAKTIWDKLTPELPLFALFRSDRPSTDQDAEIQDPMKLAIKQAISELPTELNSVKERVQAKAIDVATRTLTKLQEISPTLATQLTPEFKTDPKWEKAFDLTLSSEHGIPLNKRGSGLRRLVLLSFFRAETERRLEEGGQSAIIYAVEEPEASQHPDNQRLLVEAMKDLSTVPGVQVLLTTHVPGLAELLPRESIRHVHADAGESVTVTHGSDQVYSEIADDLGILPDRRVRVLVCMEGPNDIKCLQHFAHTLHSNGNRAPDLSSDRQIAMFPLGGSTLRDWVQEHYLRALGIPEIHIYDRGHETPPKYQQQMESVNGRTDGSKAFMTSKRELENYLHTDAITSTLGVGIVVDDVSDVPLSVARAVHELEAAATPWNELSPEKVKDKERSAKRRLNSEVAAAMTVQQLEERDSGGEIRAWLDEIVRHLPS